MTKGVDKGWGRRVMTKSDDEGWPTTQPPPSQENGRRQHRPMPFKLKASITHKWTHVMVAQNWVEYFLQQNRNLSGFDHSGGSLWAFSMFQYPYFQTWILFWRLQRSEFLQAGTAPACLSRGIFHEENSTPILREFWKLQDLETTPNQAGKAWGLTECNKNEHTESMDWFKGKSTGKPHT